MSEREILVELDGVRKEFGDVVAVREVDFAVERGEFFSLVGPSGCGKTTTLRMISGFETPTEGDVTIDGASMIDVAPEDRDTNLVFQHLSLFPHMSVGDNVAYGLKKAGIPAGAAEVNDGRSDAEIIDDLVEEHLALVDLGGFADRNPTELSGGQQQRVALARALVNEPSVILLDEPLSSLDRKLRKEMQVELRRIHERTRGAFFYVTHDQEVAMTLSDRIAVMNDGRIEQVGPPEEIYRDPATPFVADFIGDTNMLDAIATPTGDGCELTLADGVSIQADAAAEGDVRVSIRPEDFGVGADGSIGGEVSERYFQGDQTNYVVAADADIPDLSVVVQGRDDAIDRGESVALDVSPDAPIVFP